jgi:hypothetical protein
VINNAETTSNGNTYVENNANAIPSTVLIDKRGNVAARVSGEVTYSSLAELIEKVSAE